MAVKDFAGRLTGLSTPFGGAAWSAKPSDKELAHRVVTFLEDRRVLYAPDECEIPAHCLSSVLEIRRELTTALVEARGRQPLDGHLKAIRAACRKFVERVGHDVAHRHHQPLAAGTSEWKFNQALGELRGVVGVHVALLADRYDLSVEDELAQILPPLQDDDDPGWLFDTFTPPR